MNHKGVLSVGDYNDKWLNDTLNDIVNFKPTYICSSARLEQVVAELYIEIEIEDITDSIYGVKSYRVERVKNEKNSL